MAQTKRVRQTKCQCVVCKSNADARIVQEHALFNQTTQMLNEKERRRFAGHLAEHYGYGGIQKVAQITGLSRQTVRRGRRELARPPADDGRIRMAGGGRTKVEKKNQPCWRSCLPSCGMRPLAIPCPVSSGPVSHCASFGTPLRRRDLWSVHRRSVAFCARKITRYKPIANGCMGSNIRSVTNNFATSRVGAKAICGVAGP